MSGCCVKHGEIGDRVLELRALTRLSCDYLERGDAARADAMIAARAALGEAIGHVRYRWQTPLLRSMRAMMEGRFDACEAAIVEARALAEQAHDPNAERCIEMHRFTMLMIAGRVEALAAQLPATLRQVVTLPDGATLSNWAIAVVGAHSGDSGAADEALQTLGRVNVMTARMPRVVLTEVAVLCGARDHCARLYASFAPDDDSNASWGPFAFACAPPVARTLAAAAFALGRVADAERHAELALALSERVRAPAHIAWVRLTWGEGLATLDPARAVPQLEQALQIGERLDMPAVVARAQAGLQGARGVTSAASVPPSAAPRHRCASGVRVAARR